MAGETSLTRSIGDILSTTRDKVAPLMADNITSRIPYLLALNASDRKELWDGGNQLHFNVLKELSAAEFYTDLGVVQTTRPQNFTRAVYEWKQAQAPVTLSGLEMAKNSGEAAIKSVVKARIEAAVLSLANTMGGRVAGVFSNLTETTLTGMTGLQALISNTPTAGTVGNIARSNGFWQNARDAIATNFNTDGLISLRTLWRTCSFGSDVPDLIVFNGSYFDNYERALQATLNYNLPAVGKEVMLDLGLPNQINYKGATMFVDDGVPANQGYLINSKYVHFVTHKDRDFELGEFVVNTDLDGIFSHIWWMGEQCFDGMRYHGVLADGDTFS